MELQISATELAERLQGSEAPQLLDVREVEEHQFAALANSTLIPLGELFARAGEIEAWKEKEIVVYCHHGVRSLHAIAQLRSLGFGKLRNLSGGIDAWSRSVDAKVPRY
ncbi:MAG: Rhodanese-related sulfurtransferase [Pedosphaera sp.]|nr:Rhodanese-related sulfurtransferase [Pedosphaera sp.]